MGLLRYQIVTGYVVAFLSMWIFALSRIDELKEPITQAATATALSPELIILLIEWAPAVAILLLGIYALSALVIGVIQFKDCPEAAIELEKQVEEAKRELKKRGLIE